MLSIAYEDIYRRRLDDKREQKQLSKSPKRIWIRRLWEIYEQQDLPALEPHLKLASPDILLPVDGQDPISNLLCLACRDERDLGWLDVLLRNGARNLQHALYNCTIANNMNGAIFLLEHGVDPMIEYAHGRLPFHSAIIGDKIEMAKFWLERYPAMIQHPMGNPISPLHLFAERYGRISGITTLRYLLGQMVFRGYNWIHEGFPNNLPLKIVMDNFITPYSGHEKETVRLFLMYGADADGVINHAIELHQLSIAEMLLAASTISSQHMDDETRLKLRMEIYFQSSLTQRLLDIL